MFSRLLARGSRHAEETAAIVGCLITFLYAKTLPTCNDESGYRRVLRTCKTHCVALILVGTVQAWPSISRPFHPRLRIADGGAALSPCAPIIRRADRPIPHAQRIRFSRGN